MSKMIYTFVVINVLLLFLMFCLGIVVKKYNIKVNYTRKVVHFSWFFLPIFIFDLVLMNDFSDRLIISILSMFFILVLLLPFCRSRINFCQTCFDSIDRPEDRPKTLFWLTSQTIAGYIVLIIFYIIFDLFAVPLSLLYMTILAVTIGDGLAEPIGVRFGKRKYVVKAFYDDRLYYRTLEGSAIVFITSLIICLFFSSFFSALSFVLLILIFPLTITIIEAKSPHTWDTPFLFFGGNLSILLTHMIEYDIIN